jgi:trimeric autotransporter adhesin
MLNQAKISIKTTFLLLVLTIGSSIVQAQTFKIVKEINSTATLGSTFSTNMGAAGNNIFFFSDDGIHGLELWKTDGTAAGTQIVKDIVPGSVSGIGLNITPQYATGNGIFYFLALDGAEIWRSDGTDAGTYLLKNFGGAFRVLQLFYHNGLLYFVANDGINGAEPWISNGTPEGTVLLKDINTGSASSSNLTISQYVFIPMGTHVYFAAGNFAIGTELWKSDGTAAGTVLVKDVAPGTSSGINFMKAAAHNGKIYFAASGASGGTELWATDGTDPGTYRVKDISPGNLSSSPNNFISFNGSLFFSASSNNNNTPGLWKSDGTDAGTVQVRDLAADGVFLTIGINNTINFFTVTGNKLFFRDASTQGLYVSDGTTAGTVLVKQTRGSGELVPFNGQIYFQGSGLESFHRSTLYKSDGTSGGTGPVFEGDLLRDLSTFAITPAILNNKLFFSGGNRDYGSELWSTDGTNAGTNFIKDINQLKAGTQTGSQNISGSAYLNGMFLFSAADDTNGLELWKTDGTSDGTVMIKDIFPGGGSSNPNQFCVVGNQVYFIANNGTTGGELWKTDGSTEGTVLVKDILPGIENGVVGRLTASGSYVYFIATHPDSGTEIWRSNGTDAGTTLVSDLIAGTGSGFSIVNTHLTYLNKAFLINSTSLKLYVGDGTANTFTEFSTDIIAAYDMAVVGNALFIGGRNVSGQNVLWRSVNGEHPVQYKILRTSDGGIFGMYQFTNCNGKLFFNANDGTSRNEPWVSDGSETGTFQLKDIQPGAGTSQPFHFTASGDKVFFQARGTGTDAELWITDGTEAGTYLVKDINPGPTGSQPSAFIASPDGKVLFTANDGVNGIELWESNGTESGTLLVKDFNSKGNGLTSLLTSIHFRDNYVLWPLNNGILFFARSAEKGQQLYVGSFGPQTFYKDTTGVCPGSNGLLISQAKGASYQWQVKIDEIYLDISDGQHFLGTTSDTLRLLEILSDWNDHTFRCVVDGAANNKTFTLQIVNYWTGAGNTTLWNNPLNWGCSGNVPDENTNVIISSGTVILTESTTVKSIWVSPGASFTVQPGVVLTIKP